MLLEVLKFVVRTRFSKPLLIFMAVMLVYFIGISAAIPSEEGNRIFGYYGTGIVALFLAMALATGGVMVYKSDRDYLFTLPLSPRDLSISIYFSQFIAFGITILFMFGYLYQSLNSALLLADLVALALTFTSLGVIAPSMTARVRAVLSVALALWTLLAFANFPFSPGSAFYGNVYGGTATLVALAAVTTAAAFRSLSRVELDMMRSLVKSTSSEIKSPNSYVGKSPVGAIYSMNLNTISLAGRMNMAGSSRYVSRRIRTRWVVAASSVAAAAYFVYGLSRASAPAVGGHGAFPGALLASLGLSIIALFLASSAVTNERLWLSLTSLPTATYFRHLVASRVISLMLILAPFAVADAALAALGYGEALAALVVTLAVIPSSYVLEVCWTAYVAPIQVKGDDITMAAQFNLRQMSIILPLFVVIIIVSAASVLLSVAVVGGVILTAVSAILTTSSGFWGRVATKLTEDGFV